MEVQPSQDPSTSNCVTLRTKLVALNLSSPFVKWLQALQSGTLTYRLE